MAASVTGSGSSLGGASITGIGSLGSASVQGQGQEFPHISGAASVQGQGTQPLGSASVQGKGSASGDVYPKIIVNGEVFYMTSVSIKENGAWKTHSLKNLNIEEFQKVAGLIEKVQKTFDETYRLSNLKAVNNMSLSFDDSLGDYKFVSALNRDNSTVIRFNVTREGAERTESDKRIHTLFEQICGLTPTKEGDIKPLRIRNREVEQTVSDGNCMLDSILKGITNQPEAWDRVPQNHPLREALQQYIADARTYEAATLAALRTHVSEQVQGYNQLNDEAFEAAYNSIRGAITDIPEEGPQLDIIQDLKERIELDQNENGKRATITRFADYLSSNEHKPYLDGFVLHALGRSLNIPIKVVNLAGETLTNNFDLFTPNYIPTENATITTVHGGNHYVYLKLEQPDPIPV